MQPKHQVQHDGAAGGQGQLQAGAGWRPHGWEVPAVWGVGGGGGRCGGGVPGRSETGHQISYFKFGLVGLGTGCLSIPFQLAMAASILDK